MKEENKEISILVFALCFTIFGIAGGFGIALSFVEGIEKAIMSIPFWIGCLISGLIVYYLKRSYKETLT